LHGAALRLFARAWQPPQPCEGPVYLPLVPMKDSRNHPFIKMTIRRKKLDWLQYLPLEQKVDNITISLLD
jgi:hypothetical protein